MTMSKRKKKEPVVIDKTPLMPTTVGNLETKENGPIVAIIWIFLFVACIIGLPYITDFVTELQNPTPTPSPNPPSSEGESPITPPSTDDDESTYYDLLPTTVINLEAYQVSNIAINGSNLTLTITNINDSGSMFLENDYYIELYDDDLTLLQRIKMANTTISSSQTFSYNVAQAIQEGVPTKIIIVEKAEQDYPPVSLVLNDEDLPILTCTKTNETIEYVFKSETEYNLQSLTRTYSYDSSNADYNNVLTQYTTLSATYNNIAGVESALTPTATGFTFTTEIDLNRIPVGTYNTTFTDTIYYPLDTEARVIAFELETSGYTCN